MEDIKSLKGQLDRIERKLDAVIENTTPCEEKQRANQASVQAMLQVLDKSPIGKNPMIREMMQPIIDMVGGRA